MSIRRIDFKRMKISNIDYQNDDVEILFDYAVIVKNMDAADEETRWHGAGSIKIEALQTQPSQLPALPSALIGADVKDNQTTYRDEIAIPFELHGSVGIRMSFENLPAAVAFFGEKMTLTLRGHEKYIEHIKAE